MNRDYLLKIYRTMLLIRRFEESTTEVHALRTQDRGRARIFGLLHTCNGQEATAVGANFALREDDQITCTYRGHGHLIAKGVDPRYVMAELFGKSGGINRGKAGSMMMSDPAHGVLGENAVVAAAIPIAVGAALSAKLDNSDRVVATFFGDGAVNQGFFHEAMNLASIWKVPVIMFCENNLYSESTPIRDMVNIERLCDRGAAYGIPSVQIDGNDVLAVLAATREAVDRARRGGGPTFIEAMTYRLTTHWIGRDGDKRPAEELAYWQKRDPISTFAAKLTGEFEVPASELAACAESVEREVAACLTFASESPPPDLSEARIGLFA